MNPQKDDLKAEWDYINRAITPTTEDRIRRIIINHQEFLDKESKRRKTAHKIRFLVGVIMLLAAIAFVIDSFP